MIPQSAATVFRVADVERALTYYKDVLGFTISASPTPMAITSVLAVK